MDSSDAIQLVVLVVLLMLSAFFSSAETAMLTVNELRIRTMWEECNKRAGLLHQIIENKGKLLSTLLIGNNLVNISASSLATSLTIKVVGNELVGVATGILTLLILLFGEITPKTLATIHSEKISLAYARIIHTLMVVLTPAVWFVNTLANGFMILMGVDVNQKAAPMTEHELRNIVSASHEDGVIESEEKQMIYNVFDLGDTHAKDIMVPRIYMTFVDVNSSYDELVELFLKNGHTRYPVYEESTDTIIGIINIKDLLPVKSHEDFNIRSILRDPYFTYEHKHISDLLDEMQENSISFVIVLDEYGATAGLLTMEDILEEIVGEIRDEYDEGEAEMLTPIVEGSEYVALGSANLDDLAEELNVDLSSEEYDSLGGYIIEKLDRLPRTGESISPFPGLRLTVDKTTRNRIDLVHVFIDRKAMEEAEKETEDD